MCQILTLWAGASVAIGIMLLVCVHYWAKKAEEFERQLTMQKSLNQLEARIPVVNQDHWPVLREGMTINEAAVVLNKSCHEILNKLLGRGIFATVNQAIDAETLRQIREIFLVSQHGKGLN